MRELEPQREPGRAISGALSVAVHLMFLAMLVVTVTWQRKPPEPVTVDLWQDLPSAPAQKAAPPPPPPPKVEVKPPPPPPPKVEPKPEPKPEPKSVEPPKPDIALQEKLEKQKLEKLKKLEEQKRVEEHKRLEEQKKAEEQKRLEEQQKLEKLQKVEQARLEEQKKFWEIRQRDAREVAAEQARREQSVAAAAPSKADADAIARIRARIRSFVVVPQELPGNPEAEFDVVVLPGGEVLSVKLRKSSGLAAYDNAVERAILKAQPLPVPSDPAAFAYFRNLHLKFRLNE